MGDSYNKYAEFETVKTLTFAIRDIPDLRFDVPLCHVKVLPSQHNEILIAMNSVGQKLGLNVTQDETGKISINARNNIIPDANQEIPHVLITMPADGRASFSLAGKSILELLVPTASTQLLLSGEASATASHIKNLKLCVTESNKVTATADNLMLLAWGKATHSIERVGHQAPYAITPARDCNVSGRYTQLRSSVALFSLES